MLGQGKNGILIEDEDSNLEFKLANAWPEMVGRDYVDQNTEDHVTSDTEHKDDTILDTDQQEDTRPDYRSDYSPFGQYRFAAVSADADPCSSIGM